MKSCLNWGDFGLILAVLNVVKVSSPKSSCYCVLSVLTPCFINCLIERGLCVVFTLPASSEYLSAVLILIIQLYLPYALIFLGFVSCKLFSHCFQLCFCCIF